MSSSRNAEMRCLISPRDTATAEEVGCSDHGCQRRTLLHCIDAARRIVATRVFALSAWSTGAMSASGLTWRSAGLKSWFSSRSRRPNWCNICQLIVGLFTVPGRNSVSWGHGRPSWGQDLCERKMGRYVICFTGYSSQAPGTKEFCQDILETGSRISRSWTRLRIGYPSRSGLFKTGPGHEVPEPQ